MPQYLQGDELPLSCSRMVTVAHGAELRHEKVISSMVGWRVLLDIRKLHKLQQNNKCQVQYLQLENYSKLHVQHILHLRVLQTENIDDGISHLLGRLLWGGK